MAAVRRFRNKRGTNWEISVDGKQVIEVSTGPEGQDRGKPRTKQLASKAEADRFMKSRIAAKLKEGFVGEAALRAEQREAQEDLKDRIKAIKAAAAGKGAHRPKRSRPERAPSSKAEASPKEFKPPRLPPSYLECVERHGTDAEFERKLGPGKRRSPKLPGYPSRLVLYPPNRLSKARKIFTKSLIPPEDLVVPHDHGNLVPFGDDTERTWMCWDPKTVRRDGEMMICFIDGEQGDQRTNAHYELEKILKAYGRPVT